MMNLSIIILNFNTKALTIACINSLFVHYAKYIDAQEMEVILVDNNSTDDSVAVIKKQPWYRQIMVIQNTQNYGFSKGNNIGAVKAKGRNILFLNSDTRIEDMGILKMVEYLDMHEKIGIIGGRLKNSNGSYQSSAGVFYTLPRVLLLLIGAERFGKLRYSPKETKSVDWVSGAMLLTKKDLFEKLGGFDENIFMYMEDMELCYRVKKMGKTVMFYPFCTVEHVSHGSSNRSFAIIHIYKGLLYFYRKHMNTLEYMLVKGLLITKAVVVIALAKLLGKTNVQDTYTKALRGIV